MKNKVHPIFTALVSFALVGGMLSVLVVHADGASEIGAVKSFISDYYGNAEDLALSVYRACNDGDITEVDRKALAALLVQDVFLENVTGGVSGEVGNAITVFSHAEEVAEYLAGLPDEIRGETVVSPTTLYSGFYHVSGDNNNYICNLYAGGSIFCSSSHFMYKLERIEDVSTSEPFTNISYGQIGTTFRTSQGSWQSGYVSDVQSFLGGYGFSYNVNNPVNMNCRFTTDYIPTINQGYQYCTSGASPFICGSGVAVSDPGGTIDNTEPWNYYNNTLVPYLSNTYGVDVLPYVIYPDGYSPDVPTTDPTEPPPIVPEPVPNVTNILAPIVVNNIAVVAGAAGAAGAAGGLIVDGFDIQFSPDGKVIIDGIEYDIPTGNIELPDGHIINVPDSESFDFDGTSFVLDPDGWIIDNTLYPNPVGIPETVPPGAETLAYTIEMPTMETIPLTRWQVSKAVLSGVPEKLDWWWDSLYFVLDDTGLFPIISIIVGIAFCGIVIHKIGGV